MGSDTTLVWTEKQMSEKLLLSMCGLIPGFAQQYNFSDSYQLLYWIFWWEKLLLGRENLAEFSDLQAKYVCCFLIHLLRGTSKVMGTKSHDPTSK